MTLFGASVWWQAKTMSKGGYPGGSARVRLTPAGTIFEGSIDPATDTRAGNNLAEAKRERRWSDSREEPLNEKQLQAERKNRKETEYRFLVACARALYHKSLSKTHPTPRRALKPDVDACGGNLGWLMKDESRMKRLKKIMETCGFP